LWNCEPLPGNAALCGATRLPNPPQRQCEHHCHSYERMPIGALARKLRNQNSHRQMPRLIEIYSPLAPVNLHDAAQNFLSFDYSVIARMRVAFCEEPRGAVFFDKAVDEKSALAMNQDNIAASDIRHARSPNDGNVAGPDPRKHA